MVHIHLYTCICSYVKPGEVELGRAFGTLVKRRANRLERKEKFDEQVDRKIALTTGGNSGIGLATAPRASQRNIPVYPHKPLISYRINRQLSVWTLLPLMIRAFGAHCQQRTSGTM